MADPSRLSLTAREHLTPSLRTKWTSLRLERRELLRLLSRFALTAPQAERFYVAEKRDDALSDVDILANPYRLFEVDRLQPDGVELSIIDQGCFPDDTVAAAHPLKRCLTPHAWFGSVCLGRRGNLAGEDSTCG